MAEPMMKAEPSSNADTLKQQSIDQLCVNTIRTLSIDAVQQANSGHPGAPMGLAPVVYELWQSYLNYDPADPLWPNRDRFVLSALFHAPSGWGAQCGSRQPNGQNPG